LIVQVDKLHFGETNRIRGYSLNHKYFSYVLLAIEWFGFLVPLQVLLPLPNRKPA